MRLVAWIWERGQPDDSPRKEMTETVLTEKTQVERPADALLCSGHMLFSLAIQKSWNAAIVKVFLGFAKKRVLVKDLHICSTRPLFHGRQPKNYVFDVHFCH